MKNQMMLRQCISGAACLVGVWGVINLLMSLMYNDPSNPATAGFVKGFFIVMSLPVFIWYYFFFRALLGVSKGSPSADKLMRIVSVIGLLVLCLFLFSTSGELAPNESKASHTSITTMMMLLVVFGTTFLPGLNIKPAVVEQDAPDPVPQIYDLLSISNRGENKPHSLFLVRTKVAQLGIWLSIVSLLVGLYNLFEITTPVIGTGGKAFAIVMIVASNGLWIYLLLGMAKGIKIADWIIRVLSILTIASAWISVPVMENIPDTHDSFIDRIQQLFTVVIFISTFLPRSADQIGDAQVMQPAVLQAANTWVTTLFNSGIYTTALMLFGWQLLIGSAVGSGMGFMLYILLAFPVLVFALPWVAIYSFMSPLIDGSHDLTRMSLDTVFYHASIFMGLMINAYLITKGRTLLKQSRKERE